MDTPQLFDFVDVWGGNVGRSRSFQLFNDGRHVSKIAHATDKVTEYIWGLDGRELEPITFEVVVSAKENPMTIESASLREELRARMKSPSIGLPEYSADPIVQRRVGRMLANFDAKFAPHAKRKSMVNSIQIHRSDKL
jgi:hypothetical protein